MARRYQLPLFTQLLQTFFSPAETVDYPFGPAIIPPGFRGRVVINAENCTGCSLCVRDCPSFALELTRESKKVYQLIYYPDRCTFCGQCELSCNFDAIYMDPTFIEATQQRESLTVILVDRKE